MNYFLSSLRQARRNAYYSYSGANFWLISKRHLLDLFNSYFQYWRNPRSYRKMRRTLKKMKKSNFGKTALVFGNGPSLNKLNSKLVSEMLKDGASLIVVNDYWRTSLAVNCVPTHYFISDPAYLRQKGMWLQNLLSYLDAHPSIQLWIPVTCPIPSLLRERALNFFDGRNRRIFKTNLFPYRPISVSPIIVHFALGFSVFTGYSTVYICGMDSSAYINVIKKNGKLYVSRNSHSYEDSVENELNYQSTSALLEDAARGFHELSKFGRFGVKNLAQGTLVNNIEEVTLTYD
jgi:hypothetical protein